MDEKELLKAISSALDNKKGEDIKILDIREVSSFTDYFILASASNQNQLDAMCDAAEEAAAAAGQHTVGVEGDRNSSWILLDCGEVIVQLFTREARQFYGLDRVWEDGSVLDPSEL